jgi:hypothetical protein
MLNSVADDKLPRMPKIFTVAAAKGGVGKTTLAYELAYLLDAPLVDLDWDAGGASRKWGYRHETQAGARCWMLWSPGDRRRCSSDTGAARISCRATRTSMHASRRPSRWRRPWRRTRVFIELSFGLSPVILSANVCASCKELAYPNACASTADQRDRTERVRVGLESSVSFLWCSGRGVPKVNPLIGVAVNCQILCHLLTKLSGPVGGGIERDAPSRPECQIARQIDAE